MQTKPGPDGSLSGWNDHQSGVDDPALREDSSVPSAAFPRCPGETPRAFGAFMIWFQLGHTRSIAAVARQLGESRGTVKNWSSKYGWSGRLHAYQAGLLQEQARQHSASHLRQAADWNRRLLALREQEWEAAQKLNAVAQCFLETCGDDEVRQMTLAQVSRALKISSAVARSAITGAELPPSAETALSPLQQQLLAGLTRIYGLAPAPAPAAAAPAPVTHPEFESANAK